MSTHASRKSQQRGSRAATPRRPNKRRELEIARTREDILMAAARTLARAGHHSVSMQDIAREVGFTAPALYGYFESKDQIFSELVALLNRELYATFDVPTTGCSFRDKVAVLLRHQLQWADARKDLFAAFLSMQLPGKSLSLRENEGPAEISRRMTEWMHAAAQCPDGLGACRVEDAATALVGLSHGFFSRWLLTGATTRLADQADTILDLFLHGLQGRQPHRGSGPE